MKFTLSWLKEHLDTEASLEEIVAERSPASGSRSRASTIPATGSPPSGSPAC